ISLHRFGVSLRRLLFVCTAVGFFARVRGLFAWGCLSPRTQRNGGRFRSRIITTGGCAKQSWFAGSGGGEEAPAHRGGEGEPFEGQRAAAVTPCEAPGQRPNSQGRAPRRCDSGRGGRRSCSPLPPGRRRGPGGRRSCGPRRRPGRP